MESFNISIAGITVGIRCIFASTKEFCRDYLTEATPSFKTEVTADDIRKEREIAGEQDERDGIGPRAFPDAYLETIALYRKLAGALLPYGCVVFHGTVVAVDGYSYMFTARSGTGKTTHAQLWLKNIKNSFILNGDKPLLRVTDDAVLACGTPWNGKEGYGTNTILPLRAICFLSRDSVNHIESLPVAKALPGLYHQMHLCEGFEETEKQLALLGEIAGRVELYHLGCNMENDAALVSCEGMSRHTSE